MQPYNMDKLYKSFSKISSHLVFYLPRTSDLNQIARYAPEEKKVEVAHYCIKGSSKVSRDTDAIIPMISNVWRQALCAYFGHFEFE